MDLESLAAAANDPKRRDTTAALLAFLLESGWPGGSMEDSATGLGVGSFGGGGLIPLSVVSQRNTASPTPTALADFVRQQGADAPPPGSMAPVEDSPTRLRHDLAQYEDVRRRSIEQGIQPPGLHDYLSTKLSNRVWSKMHDIRVRAGIDDEDD